MESALAIAFGLGLGAMIGRRLLGGSHADPEWYRADQIAQRWRDYGHRLGRYLRR